MEHGNAPETSASTPTGSTGSRYRSAAAIRRNREGVLSPSRVTSPPVSQTRSSAANLNRERSDIQTPDSNINEIGSVSSAAGDSGYNASQGGSNYADKSHAGLWNKLEDGKSPGHGSRQAPGTFLFGGRTNVSPPKNKVNQFLSLTKDFRKILSLQSEASEENQNPQRAEFEPEAEAAMNSMTSIKNVRNFDNLNFMDQFFEQVFPGTREENRPARSREK